MNVDLLKVAWRSTGSCTSYNSYNRTQRSVDKSLGCLYMEVYDAIRRDEGLNDMAVMVENATFLFANND